MSEEETQPDPNSPEAQATRIEATIQTPMPEDISDEERAKLVAEELTSRGEEVPESIASLADADDTEKKGDSAPAADEKKAPAPSTEDKK